MSVIASQIPDVATEFSMISEQMKSMIEALSRTLGQPSTDVFDKLLKIKVAQEKSGKRLKLRNHLAGVYNANGGAEGNGLSAIKADPGFEKYIDICGQNEEEVIAGVKFTSECYDETFWKHFERLKKYRDTHPKDIVEVDGVSILTVCQSESASLYLWLAAMTGYQNNFHFSESQYGIKAYKRPGSIEYESLSRLNVSFNVEEYKEAMTQRVRNGFTSDEVGSNHVSFMRLGGLD